MTNPTTLGRTTTESKPRTEMSTPSPKHMGWFTPAMAPELGNDVGEPVTKTEEVNVVSLNETKVDEGAVMVTGKDDVTVVNASVVEDGGRDVRGEDI